MAAPGFRHEALVYSGEDEFLSGALPFIREGIAGGEPVMVAVDGAKTELLQRRLNGSADRVTFVDMRTLGHNPALIIPAWQDFVAENAADGRHLRGMGEPFWPERSAAEVVECHHHESLINLAFDGGPPWWLLCPYDASALDPAVLKGADHNHPFVDDHGHERDSDVYRRPAATEVPFDGPLADPPGNADELGFASPADLEAVRRFVADYTAAKGVDRHRGDGLVLAVDEVATNSLRHGGGSGILRVWSEGGGLICEVSDSGTITEPLVGRVRPPVEQGNGRGLWIANHFCDLVQIRSSRAGTVVRCHLGAIAPR